MKYFHVPEEVGISRQAIANFLQALQAHNYRLHALMIARRAGVCYADAVAPSPLFRRKVNSFPEPASRYGRRKTAHG